MSRMGDIMASGSNVFPQQTPNPFTEAQNGAVTGSIKWSCQNCTFDNTGQRDKCEMCEAPNPRGTAVAPPKPPAPQRPLTPQPPPNPPSETPSESSGGFGNTVKNVLGVLYDAGVQTFQRVVAPASSNDPQAAQSKKPQNSLHKPGDQRLYPQLAPSPPVSTKPSNQRPSAQHAKAKDKTASSSNSQTQTNTKPPTTSSTGPSTAATASPKTTATGSQSKPATGASVTKDKPSASQSSNSTPSASGSGSPSKFGRQFSISSEQFRHKEEVDAQNVLDAILASCVGNNVSFVDPSFPPNERSLYGPRGRNHVTYTFDPFVGPVPGATAAAANLPVAWLRPQQIAPTDKDWSLAFHDWALFRDPRPGDITQGLLGICVW